MGHPQPRAIEMIDRATLHERCKAQGVAEHSQWALRCPACGTVQSPASLHAAGADWKRIESLIGFSCEGRLTDAGPWPRPDDTSAKAAARRKVRGCDWTLGGLFRIHRLEVKLPAEDGEGMMVIPCFEVATPEEAQALEREMAGRGTPPAEEPA